MAITISYASSEVTYTSVKAATRDVVAHWYAHNLATWQNKALSDVMICATICDFWIATGKPETTDEGTYITNREIFVAIYDTVVRMRTAYLI
jgi:hypothetical protein